MILTDKAREDFNDWYWNVWFEDKERESYQSKEEALYALNYTDVVFMNAILIEWLDSVGIYISTDYAVIDDSTLAFVYSIVKYLEEGKGRKKDSWDFIERIDSFDGYSTDYYADRQEATRQAIIKANEIYNETTTKRNGI